MLMRLGMSTLMGLQRLGRELEVGGAAYEEMQVFLKWYRWHRARIAVPIDAEWNKRGKKV